MDLQQQAQIVAGIRDKMKESIGTKVYIKVNLGRSRVNENDATIVEAHPSVFIAKLEYRRGRTAEQSFQYADILTGVVEVLLDDKPMFGPFDIQPDAPLVDSANKPKVKKRLRPVKPFEQRIRLSSEQVAMLAERLKKEAEDKKTSSDHYSIINDLSRKYDLMKKAEKTKSTWNNVDKKQLEELAKKAKAGDSSVVGSASDASEDKDDRLSEILKDKEVLKNLILSEEESGIAEKKKTSTPKKGAAKAKPAIKKTSAKKTSAKKTSAKAKSAANKTTAKSKAKPKAAKKPAAKKSAAKKPAAKPKAKATAKKATAKKAAVKKSAAKKKPSAKKSTAKQKPAAKKPATKAKIKSKTTSKSKSKTSKKK